MGSSDTHRYALRFLALAPLPPLVGLGLIWGFWVFAYFAIPIFFPFLAYEEGCSPIGIRGAPTIFRDTGWYWSAGYQVLIVATTTGLTFRRSYGQSVAALVLVTVAFSAITHLALNLAGFCARMDTP
jgi:hypothetical protein